MWKWISLSLSVNKYNILVNFEEYKNFPLHENLPFSFMFEI